MIDVIGVALAVIFNTSRNRPLTVRGNIKTYLTITITHFRGKDQVFEKTIGEWIGIILGMF